jgi:hypothetical protein
MNKTLVLLVATFILASCASGQPVYNVDNHPMPAAARDLPTDRIGTLIIEAGKKREWTFQQAETGHLIAIHIKGQYAAVADIYFDQKSYRIQKKSTAGFSDQNGQISRHYNNWIHHLEGDIEAQLTAATP